MPGVPPEELDVRITSQDGVTPTQINAQLRAEVDAVARRLVADVTGRLLPANDLGLLPYVRRIWGCIEWHWQRFAEAEPVKLAEVVSRLESVQLGLKTSLLSNILREVVLAQALEQCEDKAAVMFEEDHMPTVRSIARRMGGEAAVELFDNLAADLILPREDRPPRIASYQGKTPLVYWLRAVVVNLWTDSQRKKRKEQVMETIPEPAFQYDEVERMNSSPCAQLLEPIFLQAVGTLETEDRVILKLLILDDVPQYELACSLGIHSGNLGIRRHKKETQIFDQIRMLSLAESNPQQAADCLDQMLTGNQTELKQRLAEVLTSAIRANIAVKPSPPNPGCSEVERS